MKKILITITFLTIAFLGYYVFSFYPYVQNISNKVAEINIEKRQLDVLYNLIILEKRINLKSMNSKMSADHLLRRQVFMAVYNEIFAESKTRNFYWRLERWLWSYMSYLNFNKEDIVHLYLYYRVYPKHTNIIQYSKTFFGKDINNLNSLELKELYKIGY